MQRIKLITKIGGKALLRLGGNGKIPGGIPHLRHHRDDGLDTDGAGKPAKISEWSIYFWNESQNEFGAKVTVAKFGNSQRSLLSPTGGVNTILPTLRARSLRHTLMLGHMHFVVQALSPVMSSMYMSVSP